MKKTVILLFLFLSLRAFAQFSTYSTYDVPYNYVGQVEDMDQSEIKSYNHWIESGLSDTLALSLINAGRAQLNLLDAPATIVQYGFATKEDGHVEVNLVLINSTPKIIKEASFTFDFENSNGEKVYDIKTGNKYLVLRFKNLAGRTSSDNYINIHETILDPLHFLKMEDAVGSPSFINKRAHSIKLIKANIIYSNGTVTNKIALFKGELLERDGPLKPVQLYYEQFYKKK